MGATSNDDVLFRGDRDVKVQAEIASVNQGMPAAARRSEEKK